MTKETAKVPLEIIRASEIEPREVKWLWYPYIPFGKVTMIQGDPGDGKSMFAMSLAALLTRGDPLPMSDQQHQPMNVIYQNTEDDADDTVVPRFIRAGGDRDRLIFISEKEKALTFTDERIIQAILQTGARVLILDPLVSYIGEDTSLNSANEVRGQFNPLIDAAKKTDCAIIVVGHMNKNEGVKAIYRSVGSIDVVAAARSALVIGRPKAGEADHRIMAVQKCNLAEKGPSILFSVEGGCIEWIGEAEVTADELVGAFGAEGGRPNVKQEMAEQELRMLLADGPVPQKVIEESFREKGISLSTIKIVKKKLGIQSVRLAGREGWCWLMPQPGEEENNPTGTQGLSG